MKKFKRAAKLVGIGIVAVPCFMIMTAISPLYVFYRIGVGTCELLGWDDGNL